MKGIEGSVKNFDKVSYLYLGFDIEGIINSNILESQIIPAVIDAFIEAGESEISAKRIVKLSLGEILRSTVNYEADETQTEIRRILCNIDLHVRDLQATPNGIEEIDHTPVEFIQLGIVHDSILSRDEISKVILPKVANVLRVRGVQTKKVEDVKKALLSLAGSAGSLVEINETLTKMLGLIENSIIDTMESSVWLNAGIKSASTEEKLLVTNALEPKATPSVSINNSKVDPTTQTTSKRQQKTEQWKARQKEMGRVQNLEQSEDQYFVPDEDLESADAKRYYTKQSVVTNSIDKNMSHELPSTEIENDTPNWQEEYLKWQEWEGKNDASAVLPKTEPIQKVDGEKSTSVSIEGDEKPPVLIQPAQMTLELDRLIAHTRVLREQTGAKHIEAMNEKAEFYETRTKIRQIRNRIKKIKQGTETEEDVAELRKLWDEMIVSVGVLESVTNKKLGSIAEDTSGELSNEKGKVSHLDIDAPEEATPKISLFTKDGIDIGSKVPKLSQEQIDALFEQHTKSQESSSFKNGEPIAVTLLSVLALLQSKGVAPEQIQSLFSDKLETLVSELDALETKIKGKKDTGAVLNGEVKEYTQKRAQFEQIVAELLTNTKATQPEEKVGAESIKPKFASREHIRAEYKIYREKKIQFEKEYEAFLKSEKERKENQSYTGKLKGFFWRKEKPESLLKAETDYLNARTQYAEVLDGRFERVTVARHLVERAVDSKREIDKEFLTQKQSAVLQSLQQVFSEHKNTIRKFGLVAVFATGSVFGVARVGAGYLKDYIASDPTLASSISAQYIQSAASSLASMSGAAFGAVSGTYAGNALGSWNVNRADKKRSRAQLNAAKNFKSNAISALESELYNSKNKYDTALKNKGKIVAAGAVAGGILGGTLAGDLDDVPDVIEKSSYEGLGSVNEYFGPRDFHNFNTINPEVNPNIGYNTSGAFTEYIVPGDPNVFVPPPPDSVSVPTEIQAKSEEQIIADAERKVLGTENQQQGGFETTSTPINYTFIPGDKINTVSEALNSILEKNPSLIAGDMTPGEAVREFNHEIEHLKEDNPDYYYDLLDQMGVTSGDIDEVGAGKTYNFAPLFEYLNNLPQ